MPDRLRERQKSKAKTGAQIWEQIVGERGVHFSKVISGIDAKEPLLKATQLSKGELEEWLWYAF